MNECLCVRDKCIELSVFEFSLHYGSQIIVILSLVTVSYS